VAQSITNSLAELKAYLGIEDETQDVKLQLILDAIEEWLAAEFELYGLKLKTETLIELRDGKNLDHIFTKFRPIISVATIHVSNDQTFDATTLVDVVDYRVIGEQGLIRAAREFTRFPFSVNDFPSRTTAFQTGLFPKGVQNVQVVYDVGFGVKVPKQVQLATFTVIDSFSQRAGKGAFKSERLGEYSYTLREGDKTTGGSQGIPGGAQMTFELKMLLSQFLKQTYLTGA
jgi:hypothetical protein